MTPGFKLARDVGKIAGETGRQLGVSRPTLNYDDASPVVRREVGARRDIEGAAQRGEETLTYPVGRGSKRDHYAAAWPEEALRAAKTLQRVDVVIKANGREAGQHGVRIEITKDDQVVLLPGLLEEGASVIHVDRHPRRVVGALGVILSPQAYDHRIDFHRVHVRRPVP